MKKTLIAGSLFLLLIASVAFAMDGHHGQSIEGNACYGTANCNGMSENHQGHMMDQHNTQSGHDMNQDSSHNAPSAHQHAVQGGTDPETGSGK